MLVTPSGIVIDVKLWQLENAVLPMLVTLPSVGISLFLQPAIKVLLAVSIKQFLALWYFGFLLSTFIDDKPLQPRNTNSPMLVTLSGIVIDVKPMQPSNADIPMLVTLPSVGITLFLQPAIKVLLTVSIKQFPVLWYTVFPFETVIDAKFIQEGNAESPSPMLVTLSGIVIVVNTLQLQNAPCPMLVTAYLFESWLMPRYFGITTVVTKFFGSNWLSFAE